MKIHNKYIHGMLIKNLCLSVKAYLYDGMELYRPDNWNPISSISQYKNWKTNCIKKNRNKKNIANVSILSTTRSKRRNPWNLLWRKEPYLQKTWLQWSETAKFSRLKLPKVQNEFTKIFRNLIRNCEIER